MCRDENPKRLKRLEDFRIKSFHQDWRFVSSSRNRPDQSPEKTGWDFQQTAGPPSTHKFCEACNRVRVTCTGRLYTCSGHEDAADLPAPLRASEGTISSTRLSAMRAPANQGGMIFIIDRSNRVPAVARHMSLTGGQCRVASIGDARFDVRVIALSKFRCASHDPASALNSRSGSDVAGLDQRNNDFRRKSVIELSQHAYGVIL